MALNYACPEKPAADVAQTRRAIRDVASLLQHCWAVVLALFTLCYVSNSFDLYHPMSPERHFRYESCPLCAIARTQCFMWTLKLP